MLLDIAVFFLALAVLILFHEFGHFIVARKNGVRVEEFGFGFPPRLFGKRVGETFYSFNLLPLGGFVKISGENESESNDPESFASKNIAVRAKIIFAGVFFNLILAFFIFSFVAWFGALELGIFPVSWYTAPLAGLDLTLSVLFRTFGGIIYLIGLVFGGHSVAGLVSGPVGIYSLVADTFDMGLSVFLSLVAMLSVNLAIINLFPIPALDGGRLLFLAVEAIRGRPVDRKVAGLAHAMGFAILITLMILVTYFDIKLRL